MSFLDRLMEHFAKINRRMKRWKRVISALSALVVFCTTYALILPAITLDKETASAQPGIEVAANEANIEEAGSTVLEETVEEEPSFAEPAGPEETIEEDPEETADEGPEYLEDEGPEDDTDGENGHNEDAESEDSERDGDGDLEGQRRYEQQRWPYAGDRRAGHDGVGRDGERLCRHRGAVRLRGRDRHGEREPLEARAGAHELPAKIPVLIHAAKRVIA